MTPNPYAPPTAKLSTSQRSVETTRIRRGPAPYIVGFGLLGGFGAIPTFTITGRNTVVVAVGCAVLVGCILGWIAYRVRSRNWPHDRTILQQQLLYSPQRQLLYAALGLVSGAGIGPLVGFVGGASFLAVVTTITGESFDGLGLIIFGIFGSPVGLVLGAPFGAIVASRSRLVIGAGIGALVGFVGGASYLAVEATIAGKPFELILYGIFGSLVGLVLGALFGAIVASRSRR